MCLGIPGRIVEITATARIHGGDKLEAGGIAHAVIGAGNDRLAVLQRLAQGIEHLWRELGQFVEKQHAVMGKRHFAGTGAQATAHEGCHRG